MGHSGVSTSHHQPRLSFPRRAGFPALPGVPPAFLHETVPNEPRARALGGCSLNAAPPPSLWRAPLTADRGRVPRPRPLRFQREFVPPGAASARPSFHKRGPGTDDERPVPVRPPVRIRTQLSWPPRHIVRWCQAAPRVPSARARCHRVTTWGRHAARVRALSPWAWAHTRTARQPRVPLSTGRPPPPVAPAGSAHTRPQLGTALLLVLVPFTDLE